MPDPTDAFFLSDTAGSSILADFSIIFPDPLIAGDEWAFSMFGGDYISSGYIATITFASGIDKFSLNAVVNPNDVSQYKWTWPGAITSQFKSQPYKYNVHVTLGQSRITIDRGGVRVVADISVPGSHVEVHTTLQLMLRACDDTLLDLLRSKSTVVQFAGQTYTMHNIKELFDVRNELFMRVKDEQEELSGNKKGRKIVTIFRNM